MKKSILSGVTKETFAEFSARTDNTMKLSFVRKDNKSAFGSVYFGNQMYGVADFSSSDNNIVTSFTDTGGLNINYNLAYDYEFYASNDTEGAWEKILYLPNGTYTFLVEKTVNGTSINGYATISVDNRGMSHSEFAVNSEILYEFVHPVSEGYGYYLCIPTKDTSAPWIRYRLKLIGSSITTKSEIEDVHGTFLSEGPVVIPCITNSSTIININSADLTTTFCTTAVPTVTESSVVGRAYIQTNDTIMDYIINTDNVDDGDRVSAVVLSDSADVTTIANLPNGLYRFKFSDALDSGMIVTCKDTSYDYTGNVYANAILYLTISDDYYEWSIAQPQIYSSDKTVKVVTDSTGGFDLTVPEVTIGSSAITEISGKVDSISGNYLSAVTINGSSDDVKITNNVADLTFIKSNNGAYNNALICAYFGVNGSSYVDQYVPLFKAKVDNNSGTKFSTSFRLMSVDSPNVAWEAEYIFDAHNVNGPLATFECIDFSSRIYDGKTATLPQINDVFYVVEEMGADVNYYYEVTFYKKITNAYDMFYLFVDYVYGVADQVNYYSRAYNSFNESIVGDLFGIKFNDDRAETFGTDYQYTHSQLTMVTSISGQNYALDWREGNVPYSGLNTTNKTLVGAVNELNTNAGNGITGITINSASTGVVIKNQVADLTIKDYQDQITYLSGVIDTLIDSLNSLKNS